MAKIRLPKGSGKWSKVREKSVKSQENFKKDINTLVNVNAPVVATTSWWLHFTAPVVA